MRASDLFQFLASTESLAWDRIEVSSIPFRVLRRSIRQIVGRLFTEEPSEERQICERLRVLLSEWLTVPVAFNSVLRAMLMEVLGPRDHVGRRWGEDVLFLYDEALAAADELPNQESQMRARLREKLDEAHSNGLRLKLYCHKRATEHFLSLETIPRLDRALFLHSVRDYRDADIFDVLVKVGPFKVRGWGAAPDSLVTAPKYQRIVQIVWSGCEDDADFGYDPVSVAAQNASQGAPLYARTKLRKTDYPAHDGIGELHLPHQDELKFFTAISRQDDKRRAVFLQVEEDQGVLYPKHAQIMSFDPAQPDEQVFARRTPGLSLMEGMFLVRPAMLDASLTGVQAQHGHFSRIWKERLAHECNADPERLVQRLEEAGLNLVHLFSAVRHWIKAPTSVIHAPQQIKHFQILIRVLGLADTPSSRQGATFWQLAWNEIRRSRGEAIQAGFQEHEAFEAQAVSAMKSRLPEIRDLASQEPGFVVRLHDDGSAGDVVFLKIVAIEDGFSAPDSELRIVRDLRGADVWRD